MKQHDYTSPALSESDVSLRALAIIRQHLDGLPIGQARRVLRHAELMMDATMPVSCSGSEFQRASEGFLAAGVQSA